MKFLTSLLCFFLTFSISRQFQVVKIGAIFFKDELHLLQIFESAINEINEREFRIQLVPIKHLMSIDDSTLLQTFTCDLIQKGVSAILGPSSKTSSDIVALICQQRGIPHLKFDFYYRDMNSARIRHSLTVNLAPSGLTLSSAYSDVLRHLGWKSFTIVYEESYNLALLQDVLYYKYIHKSGIKLKSFRRGDDYRILWKSVNNAHEKFILLHCSADILYEVLNVSAAFNMTGPFSNFFLTDLDAHTADLWRLYSNDAIAKMTAVRVRSYIPPQKTDETDVLEVEEEDICTNLTCQLVYDAVLIFFNAVMHLHRAGSFTEPNRVLCNSGYWHVGPKLVSMMKELTPKNSTLHYKTQRLLLNKDGERDEFNLMIYNPIFEQVSHFWNRRKGLVSADDVTVPKEARSQHHNKMNNNTDPSQRRLMFKVATRIGEPYFMWKPEAEGEHFEGNERFMGYAVDLIYKLADECKFDFVFEPVPDNNYGSYDPKTQEWNGIIRQLIDNNAQIGICDLTITQARRTVVDFTVPFMQLGISVLHYKQTPDPPKLFAFLKPYKLEVWIYLLLVIVIMSLVSVFIARLSRAEWVSEEIVPTKDTLIVSNTWTLRNTLWLNVGSIMAQGCDILPRGGPMRLYLASFWIFALIIGQTYIAQLASVITSAKMKQTINSFEDLVDQNKIHFGFIKGGSTSVYFSESNDSNHRVAWSKMLAMKPDAFTASNKEGVDRVLRSRGLYAFLMETTTLQYYLAQNCTLTQIGSPFGGKHYGLAVPLNAPYRSNLSVGILKLSEKGILYKLKKRWFYNEKLKCSDTADDDEEKDSAKLDMDAFLGLFLVLIAGTCVAFLIGILEFLWNVEKLSYDAKIPTSQVLKAELKFFFSFWKKRKPINIIETNPEPITSILATSRSITSIHKKKNSKKKIRLPCYNK